MAGPRLTNVPTSVKQQQLLQSPHGSVGSSGSVPIRTKSSQTSADRLSQSKSMVLQEFDLPLKQISRHRRNQSQHDIIGVTGSESAAFDPLQGSGGTDRLNVTKISECGKKLKKNWTLMSMDLKQNQLHCSKESNQKPSGKTDVVQLCGAVIQWTKEKSNRKNVFQITTSSGSEFLLQVDCRSTACRWFDSIRRTIDSSTRADGGFPLRRSNSSEVLPRHGSLPGFGSSSSKNKAPNPVHRRSINMFSISKLKHSSSSGSDKNGVRNRLKKFMSRRPSIKTLQEKGLIKDRVFGCPLVALCEREGTTVPKFVQLCVDVVERRGLEIDGIYRVSGNLATIQKLRFIVDQEEELDLDHSQWEDIHVITGALKMFFRELPEPLFPFKYFQSFVEAIRIKEREHKVQVLKKLIQDLPKPNHDTMKLIFIHLNTVLTFASKNLMSNQGIGIVFGPTLMWPELDSGNMAVNTIYQSQIVELILKETQEIFGLTK